MAATLCADEGDQFSTMSSGRIDNGFQLPNEVAFNEFEFIPPPEAPVFRPTDDDFALGPLEYIQRIRAQAEPYGICKIIPPSSFQPPFAVNVDEFRFTPRVQRLNELEATTRIKLNFIEQLVKFWDLQGASFRIPCLKRRALDLYNLHKIVKEEGGFEHCTRNRRWSKVAARMGFGTNPANRATSSLLRQHYEKILFPYDVFQSGATFAGDDDVNSGNGHGNSHGNSHDQNGDSDNTENTARNGGDDVKGGLKSPSANQGEKRELRVLRHQRSPNQAASHQVSPNQSKELKKLQFYGAGPKMPGVQVDGEAQKKEEVVKTEPKDDWSKSCLTCGEATPTHLLLSCDHCDNTYHTTCLIPPLTDWPKGVWHCHKCLAQLVQQQPAPYQEFGFVQSQKLYTLAEFGEMADQFKADYFHTAPHRVPLATVEREFWRLVSSMDESVAVEYGADLHTNDYGSGFPIKTTKNLLPTDADYIDSPWNLNNLPILDGSVFRHINASINGMIIPWMYVGMCFATFCWHNEDHWTYSINYLHWGEPKTWYGVPGEHAETFELAMKRTAPELFQSQPDLLHQLVTICNPNLLMQDGVPVYRTNQHAGEFVVTFPRAYHTGFNQGLNFAEAVNFAPCDWLPIGRTCVTHYAQLRRYPVFSHDELICKMAIEMDALDMITTAATLSDMRRMVEVEKAARLVVFEWGVTMAEREPFELLPDDERQCVYCKTTCFLSALTCGCSHQRLVCLPHKDQLCHKCVPEAHTLRYRYTLDELPIMLKRLRSRVERFDSWTGRVRDALETSSTLQELKRLLDEAKSNRYPKNLDEYEQLASLVSMVSKMARATRDLLRQQQAWELEYSGKRSLRATASRAATNHEVTTKLTMTEIEQFCTELESLGAVIPETKPLRQLVDKSRRLFDLMESHSAEDSKVEPANFAELDNLVSEVCQIGIVDFGGDFEELKSKVEKLRAALEEANSSSAKAEASGATVDAKRGKKRKKRAEDELCSMGELCQLPNEDEVNWVQCDGPCQEWFHQVCIGIETPDQIEAVDQFFCHNCRKST